MVESERFDRLARFVGRSSSRRAALRGLAKGALGGALGVAAATALSGDEETALAKSCNGNAQCKNPKNPCKKRVCKNKKCREKNKRNGMGCGDDRVCQNGRCVADCDAGGATCTANVACCSGTCTCGTGETAGLCQENFFQGFEQNTDGWTDVERVGSGTDGITARTGDFLAKVAQNAGSFTRWGGYANAFPDGGYVTETAIFIDIENAPDVDTRFDYSSAVNRPNCEHRRDFVFNGGVNLVDAEPTFCVSASNDGNGWPCNPDREPVTLDETGWYVFRHEFNDESGVLSVDLILLGPD